MKNTKNELAKKTRILKKHKKMIADKGKTRKIQITKKPNDHVGGEIDFDA